MPRRANHRGGKSQRIKRVLIIKNSNDCIGNCILLLSNETPWKSFKKVILRLWNSNTPFQFEVHYISPLQENLESPSPHCCGKSNTYRLWHWITNNIIKRHLSGKNAELVTQYERKKILVIMCSQTCNAPQKSSTWSLIDCTRVKWENDYFKDVWNAITKIYWQLSSFVTKDVTEQTVLNIVYTCTNKDAQEDLQLKNKFFDLKEYKIKQP